MYKHLIKKGLNHLNLLISSWTNFYDHDNYVEWLSSNIFNSVNFNTAELNHYVDDIFNIDVTKKIKLEIADLTFRENCKRL